MAELDAAPVRVHVAPLLGGLVAIAFALLARPAWGAVPESSPTDSTAEEITLEHREASQSVARWSLSLRAEAKPFLKEPEAGSRKVARGWMSFPGPGAEEISLLWDSRGGKLYLDLNHNRDLTDDSAGVFSTTPSRYNDFNQVFTNVHLPLKTAAGTYDICVDLHLYGPEAPQVYGYVMCRSFWHAKVPLGGRDWQIGRVDSEPRSLGEKNRGCLLLRPWEERDQPFEIQNGLLDTFFFSEYLFFGGQAYRLGCEPLQQDGKAGYRLSVRKTSATLGELKVAGKFIHRMLLAPAGTRQADNLFTVVLDRPEGVVNVPVGEYSQLQAQLQSAQVRVYRDLYGQSGSQTVTVAAGIPGPAVVAAGGPLTNSVSAERRGRDLSLQYQLLGADGARYTVFDPDRSNPPRFSISRNGKEIHSGKFEYG